MTQKSVGDFKSCQSTETLRAPHCSSQRPEEGGWTVGLCWWVRWDVTQRVCHRDVRGSWCPTATTHGSRSCYWWHRCVTVCESGRIKESPLLSETAQSFLINTSCCTFRSSLCSQENQTTDLWPLTPLSVFALQLVNDDIIKHVVTIMSDVGVADVKVTVVDDESRSVVFRCDAAAVIRFK